GGHLFLNYGESFASPRLFAEALTMASLGFMINRQLTLAWVALIAATVAHPLIAVPGFAFVIVYSAFSDRRWIYAPAGAAAVIVGLALLGIQPFARLFVTFDSEWLRIVESRCAYAFVTRWTMLDYARLSSTLALAAVSLVFADASVRRFLVVAMIV